MTKFLNISPQKFTFLFPSESFIDVQCMPSHVFNNSNITHPLNWVLDGIILLLLHFPIVCFILVLINYKQDCMHMCGRHSGWFCYSQVIIRRVRITVSYDSTSVLPKRLLFLKVMPTKSNLSSKQFTNTLELRANSKATQKYDLNKHFIYRYWTG